MIITLKTPAVWMIPVKTHENKTLTWINAAMIRRFTYNPATHKAEIEWNDGKRTYCSGDEVDEVAKALNLCPGLNNSK